MGCPCNIELIWGPTELRDVMCWADSLENEGELPSHYVSAPLAGNTLQQTVHPQKTAVYQYRRISVMEVSGCDIVPCLAVE